ncbi:MAG: hypothetical protein WBD73_16595 [Candidatus Acidiferrales bacterium]
MRKLAFSKLTKRYSKHRPVACSATVFAPGASPGHHIAIIEFVRARIDKKHIGLLAVFDRLRRKQNTALYDDIDFVSHHDAKQALETTRECVKVIRTDIVARKPCLWSPESNSSYNSHRDSRVSCPLLQCLT